MRSVQPLRAGLSCTSRTITVRPLRRHTLAGPWPPFSWGDQLSCMCSRYSWAAPACATTSMRLRGSLRAMPTQPMR